MDVKKMTKRFLTRVSGFMRKDQSGKVIYYHDISNRYTYQGTPLELFQKHINVIHRNGFEIVSNLPSKDKEVMICFDDGWRGIWDNRKYFIDNKICPTVFLIVDFIGREGYLSKKEIMELQNFGFRFQGHTYSHKNVTEVYGDDLRHELIESREELSRVIGKTVDEFCFPRGEYSDELIEMALANGYEKVYICTPGSVKVDDTTVHRNLVQHCSPQEFKAVLNGGLEMFATKAEKLHHK